MGNGSHAAAPRRVLIAGAEAAQVPLLGSTIVACAPPPSAYSTPPSVSGSEAIDLALGAGPGPGVDNPNLCFVHDAMPASPTLRVQQGTRLAINLTNTLANTGSAHTENCAIENYVGGPPVAPTCAQPEHGFIAAPGPDGSYYPIQTNVPHLSDGATNLHLHGLEVSPAPCHDDVLHSVIYAVNWGGGTPDLLPCQKAPNELSYTYDIAPDHPAGLYFYHTHWHGHALAQTMMGASGALVIEGEEDRRRAALGVTDDIMVIRDFPSAYVADEAAPLVPVAAPAAAAVGDPASHAVDPRIDRENIASCPADASDAGGPPVTRLTLNGALVKEAARFPPPDDKVLTKTMKPGERQLWRLVNASAQTYVQPQLVLSQGGQDRVLPLQVIALDGAPVHDNAGHRRIDVIDTTKHPLVLATANRVEFLVHAPPPGATLYLDSAQMAPGCAADGIPARRLLRVVTAGDAVPPDAAAASDADIQPQGQETADTNMLGVQPSVRRVFAFTEYPRGFTVSKSNWVVGPPGPGQFNPNSTDFFLTMIASSDGQASHVAVKPFVPDSGPDVVIHLNGQDSVLEEWTVQNYSLEVHPFHMHQMHFRDVTEGDGVDDRAPILDTVNVPPASRHASSKPGIDMPATPGAVRLRLKFTREMIGDFVFHCHILAHEDKGMMQKIRVVAD